MCFSGEVLLPCTTPAVLLVVDNFADANPYLPFHPEHSVPVSYRVRGCMRYGCVSRLCSAPWTEPISEAGCFLKPLVWEGPTNSLNIKLSSQCPCCPFSAGRYVCEPASKYPLDPPQGDLIRLSSEVFSLQGFSTKI